MKPQQKITWSLLALMTSSFVGFGSVSEVSPAKKLADFYQIEELDSVQVWSSLIEKDPENLSVHQKYIKAVGISDPNLIEQYQKWSTKFPESSTVPFALGNVLASNYDYRAKEWLLKAVEINPKLANAWQQLSFDAERWGDEKLGSYYMNQASKAEPENPNYAFYSASSLKTVDPESYERAMLKIVERFPTSERAAQSLYWLANREQDLAKKKAFYERSRREFPANQCNWSASSMGEYFAMLLKHDPEAALTLASEMVGVLNESDSWIQNVAIAEQVSQANQYTKEGKTRQALEVMLKPKKGRLYGMQETLALMTTDMMLANGDQQMAFDSLLNFYVKTPSYNSREKLLQYGQELGFDRKSVERKMSDKLKSIAVPATRFDLEKYIDGGQLRLDDLRGKVVLVTYWYPGCGPCRGEFPHFENVLKAFDRAQVEYVGINISPKEDPYVLPFMKASGHTFIPVKDQPENRGNLVAMGAPTNYLIDKEGNIIYKNFMIGNNNEESLELMIKHLLEL